MRNRQKQRQRAFTLIELLVVMAIVSALVGILSVGLRTVKVKATNLKQKGEFHGMEVSLELFYNDFDRYPESTVINGGADVTCGAQHLAEAMEGRDEQGFHPKSKWHPDLEPVVPDDLYNNTTLRKRKPVYFELKHSGLYTPEQLWGSSDTGNLHPDECPVITDVFVRNVPDDTTIDGKVGSPVLYYRADSTKEFRIDSSRTLISPATQPEYKNWIYNFDDNIDILNLKYLREPDSDTDTPTVMSPHYQAREDYPGATEAELFYQILTNRADTAMNYYKPHNKNTFILISAGWDGKYGTDDDLTNFNY